MEKFYLTNNGDILNTEKGYLQTAEGKFIRRVFSREIVYAAENKATCYHCREPHFAIQ